jgi:hypothetical protein
MELSSYEHSFHCAIALVLSGITIRFMAILSGMVGKSAEGLGVFKFLPGGAELYGEDWETKEQVEGLEGVGKE